jgi:hypothetical protein
MGYKAMKYIGISIAIAAMLATSTTAAAITQKLCHDANDPDDIRGDD